MVNSFQGVALRYYMLPLRGWVLEVMHILKLEWLRAKTFFEKDLT